MNLGKALKRLHVVPLKREVPAGMEEPKRQLETAAQEEAATTPTPTSTPQPAPTTAATATS